MKTDANKANLSARNLAAWDALYGQTEKPVWGKKPVGFLRGMLQDSDIDFSSRKRILDLGCGEGRNIRLLKSSGASVFACDGSHNALLKARCYAGCDLQSARCSFTALPFRDGSFDLIVLSDVLETVPVPEPLLREAGRLLTGDGRMICNVPDCDDSVAGVNMEPLEDEGYLYRGDYYYCFRNEADAVRMFSASGLKVIEARLCRWREEPHPGFRSVSHEHTSRVFIIGRKDSVK